MKQIHQFIIKTHHSKVTEEDDEDEYAKDESKKRIQSRMMKTWKTWLRSKLFDCWYQQIISFI